MRRLVAALAIVGSLAACGGGGGGSSDLRVELAGVTVETFASGLPRPEGLAFDPSGRLFVTLELGGDDGELVRLDAGGPSVVLGGLDRPDGVAFDGAGRAFVAEEIEGGRVLRVADGVGVPFLEGLAGPEALAFDPSGNLWVTEDIGGRVLRADPTGAVVQVSMLRKPEGIAIAPDGRVWVAESGANRIVRLAANGIPEPLPDVGLQQPDGLAFDAPSGSLLVGEDRPGGARLLRIGPDGSAVTVLSGLEEAQGIAIGADRAVYLCESGRGRVLRVLGVLGP